MASTISLLNELTPEADGWRVRVRLVRLWKQHVYMNPEETSSLDMVLMDELGNKIQATVKKVLISRFERHLVEGNAFLLYGFGVTENFSGFKMTSHPHKIILYRSTTLQAITSLFSAPRYGFDFKPFADILASNVNTEVAVDIIGRVVRTGEQTTSPSEGRITKRVPFELEDMHGVRMNCTLWGWLSDQYVEALSTIEPNAYMILVLQFARIKVWQGTITVTNCFYGTRLLVNPQTEECSFFTVSDGTDPTICRFNGIQSTGPASALKIFTTDSRVQTITELRNATQPYRAVLFGTIIYLEKGEDWYYTACRKCTRVVHPSSPVNGNDAWFCSNCQKTAVDVCERFRIRIRVQDSTGSVSLVVFDRDVCAVIKKTAHEVLEEQSTEPDAGYYPIVLDTFLGMTCMFKVNVDDYNIRNNYHVYSVIRMTDDETIMNQVLLPVGSGSVGAPGPETPAKVLDDKRGAPTDDSPSSSHQTPSKRMAVGTTAEAAGEAGV